MRRSEALKKRQLMELAAERGLEDAQALEAPEFFPRWDPAAAYEAGQRRRFEGTLYRCLQSHTAQPNWDPVSTPSLWARVLIEDPDTVPEWVQPDSTNGYSVGDRVRHHGIVWISELENNVWEPGIYGWKEEE